MKLRFLETSNKNIISKYLKFGIIAFDSIFFFKKKTNLYSQFNLNGKKKINTNIETFFNNKISIFKQKINKKKIKQFKSKLMSILSGFIKFYNIKTSRMKKFSFNYLWYNILSLQHFFFSSYSKINYSWLTLKNTRSNFFSTFFYTGNLTAPKYPTDIETTETLISNLKKYTINAIPRVFKKEKEHFSAPYNLHPYIVQSKSPYSHVISTCSAGTLKFKKKAKRSRTVVSLLVQYYSVYFHYFFSLYSIDFFFLKLNGFFRNFKFWKKIISKNIRNYLHKLKYQYRVWKRYRKTIVANKKHDEGFRALANTLIRLSKHSDNKLIPKDYITEEDDLNLKRCFEMSDKFIVEQKNKQSKVASKIIFYASRYPKSIYWINSTSYPFNGCRRVRHYK